MPHYTSPAGRQHGTVLVIAMIMLIVLVMLGLTAMKTSTLEEKMAGGTMDQNIAFQAAENAMRDAEQYIFSTLNSGSAFVDGCAAGLCLPSTTATNVWESIDWTGAIPITYGAMTNTPAITGVALQPKYIVELLAPDVHEIQGEGQGAGRPQQSGGTMFRITAVGWGKQSGTQVMLQSVFVKQ